MLGSDWLTEKDTQKICPFVTIMDGIVSKGIFKGFIDLYKSPRRNWDLHQRKTYFVEESVEEKRQKLRNS